MKGKTYRFIFSALLLCASFASKGQTVDGKLYTIFNNWYQWSGGKFNTNLNIPKVTATTGRDTGAIRYALTDSSMYVWTGSQWRQVGGSTPTLQQVTTAGNTTTDTVTVAGLRLPSQISTLTFRNAGINALGLYSSLGGFAQLYVSDLWSTNTYSNNFHVRNNTNNFTGVFSGTVTANRAYTIPDTTGNLSVGVAVNGTTYMAGTNGITNIGNTDTATVVKAYVTNAEAVTITKGQVVYIFGASGDRASVKLARNTSDTFSSKTLGIVREDIAAGAAGWITTQGQVSGINLGAYSPGDILWLDSVAGGFTATKPVAPYHSVFVGVVERANAGNGLIYVKPQNGQELGELHDTKITSPTNNQVLAYTAATDIWENKSVTTALGYTPLNVTDTTAMLSPYLRKVDTLSLSNRITNATGVQWGGIDSSFAAEQARRGRHEIEEFTAVSSSINLNLQQGAGTYSFRTSNGSFTGFHDDNTQGVRMTVTNSGNITFIFNGPTANSEFLNVLQLSSDWVVWTARVRIPTIADATDRYSLRLGIETGLNNASIVTGMAFIYDLYGSQTGSSASANWQTVTSKANTRTYNQNSSNVAVSANTWTILKIVANSSNVYFYVNNTLIGTHTTNLPTTTNIYPLFDFRKTLGTNARTCEIDYSTIDIKYSTPR